MPLLIDDDGVIVRITFGDKPATVQPVFEPWYERLAMFFVSIFGGYNT